MICGLAVANYGGYVIQLMFGILGNFVSKLCRFSVMFGVKGGPDTVESEHENVGSLGGSYTERIFCLQYALAILCPEPRAFQFFLDRGLWPVGDSGPRTAPSVGDCGPQTAAPAILDRCGPRF